jgi:hypothetical protein
MDNLNVRKTRHRTANMKVALNETLIVLLCIYTVRNVTMGDNV